MPTFHSAQDINALVRDFTKWDDQPVSPQHFAQSFVRAYKIAMTPPHEPVMIALDLGLQQEPMRVLEKETLYIPKYVPTAPPQGDTNAVREAARLLANAEHPVIVADRAARTGNGSRLLVELAEALQAPVIDKGGRMNMPNTHYLNQTARTAALIGNADVIIGLELADYWATVNNFIDNGLDGVGYNQSRTKPGTKLISITSVPLVTKSNYQDFQRFQAVDVEMLGDAEATLPALIEAVKAAIPSDRKAALEKRGADLKKAYAEPASAPSAAAAVAWDASPISTARMAMEIYAQIKDLDFSLVSSSGNVSGWPNRLWRMEKHHNWLGGSGGSGVGYGSPAAVGRGARQPRHRRPFLRQHPGRRRLHVCAGRAVDGGAAQDSDPQRHAQQPRLSPGSHACAAAWPTGATASPRSAWTAARSAPASRTRTSITPAWPSRWATGAPARSRIRPSLARPSSGPSRSSRPASRRWSTFGRSRAKTLGNIR